MMVKTTICKEVTISHLVRQLTLTEDLRIITKTKFHITTQAKESLNLSLDHLEFLLILVRMFIRLDQI